MQLSGVRPSVRLSVPLQQRRSSFDTVQQPGCGSTGPQHGTQQQTRTVPCLHPRDADEHRDLCVVWTHLKCIHSYARLG